VVAGALGVGLDVAALQVRDDALEALGLLAGAVFRGPLEVNQIVGAVEELPLNRLVQLLEGVESETPKWSATLSSWRE